MQKRELFFPQDEVTETSHANFSDESGQIIMSGKVSRGKTDGKSFSLFVKTKQIFFSLPLCPFHIFFPINPFFPFPRKHICMDKERKKRASEASPLKIDLRSRPGKKHTSELARTFLFFYCQRHNLPLLMRIALVRT